MTTSDLGLGESQGTPIGFLFLMVGFAAACGVDGTTAPACAPALRLEPDTVILGETGDSAVLSVFDDNSCSGSLASVTWMSTNPHAATVSGGVVTAVTAGPSTVVATVGAVTTQALVHVERSRGPREFNVLGYSASPTANPSSPLVVVSDLWLYGPFALTGLFNVDCQGSACQTPFELWDLADPDEPVPVGSVPTPTSSVLDVKIAADGSFAVVSQFDDSGIVILDLANPLAPVVRTQFGQYSVHNLWIETIGGTPYVFLALAGDEVQDLRILDLSDLDNPVEVASYSGGSSLLHDVYVRDGLAFVSHWDLGLIILDVGNGTAGGSPSNPVELSRLFLDGETHNAWYWPARGYVFVGEEDPQLPEEAPGSVGVMHVIDVRDLRNPVEVATYTPGNITPHNFWLDEQNEILYTAWYSSGVRAIDVSGVLSGDLLAQGRELASIAPLAPGRPLDPPFWAAQLHNGRVYATDGTGIWVFQLN